jgi:hypothetical protein
LVGYIVMNLNVDPSKGMSGFTGIDGHGFSKEGA